MGYTVHGVARDGHDFVVKPPAPCKVTDNAKERNTVKQPSRKKSSEKRQNVGLGSFDTCYFNKSSHRKNEKGRERWFQMKTLTTNAGADPMCLLSDALVEI